MKIKQMYPHLTEKTLIIKFFFHSFDIYFTLFYKQIKHACEDILFNFYSIKLWIGET